MVDYFYKDTIKRGSEFLANGDYANAILVFNDLYISHPTKEGNFYLTSAYFLGGQYQEAFQTVFDMPEAYEDEIEKTALAIDVSIRIQQYIFAREMIIRSKAKGDDVLDLIELVEKDENEFRKHNQPAIEQMQRNLIYLGGSSSLIQQEEKYVSSMNLPYREFINAAQIALLDENVSPFLRSSIISVLAKLNLDELIEFIWIDGKQYKVKPSKQKDIEKSSVLKKIVNSFDEMDINDQTKQLMTSYAMVFISAIYPKLNVIKEPEKWADTIVKKTFGDDTDNNYPDEYYPIVEKYVLTLIKETQ